MKFFKAQTIGLVTVIIMIGTVFFDIFIELNILKFIIWFMGYCILLILLHKVGISRKSKGVDLFYFLSPLIGAIWTLGSIIAALI